MLDKIFMIVLVSGLAAYGRQDVDELLPLIVEGLRKAPGIFVHFWVQDKRIFTKYYNKK
jgi:hypothetical protein